MGSKYRKSFFESKREWSKYKDSVLDYYLTPYLQIVKNIRKPICVVDMFAGRGEFETGEPGSPRIIATQLQKIAQQGHEVKLRCYENHPPFYDHLVTVVKQFSFAEVLPKDCFSDIEAIEKLAATHTLLLYIDPFDAVQLSLSKLGLIFNQVRQNSSVEALVVFMARAFMRQAAALTQNAATKLEETGAISDPLIRDAEEDDKAMWLEVLYGNDAVAQYTQLQNNQRILSDIVGGDYWNTILQDTTITFEEKCARLVDEYRQKLRNWFKVVESLPVFSDCSNNPKYWITFMSRYEPAFDLFNRAACDMFRAQRQNFRNQPGSLFAETPPQAECAQPQSVDREVKRAAQPLASCRWNALRWRTCGNRNVGKFTDSEVNQSIKRLLRGGWLAGASGDKVEEEAVLSPTVQLKSWTDR